MNRVKILIESLLKEDSKLKTSLKEADVNDEVLIRLRAQQIKANQTPAEIKKKAPSGRVYGKKREELEDKIYKLDSDLFYLKQDLKELQSDKTDIMNEMDANVDEMKSNGGKMEDDDYGNYYGEKLNKVNKEIEDQYQKVRKIQDQIDNLELKLNL